jgi:hypothetical protein
MRFSLRSLLIAIALISVFFAHPLYVFGLAVLFVACSLVGGLFILVVLIPFEKTMEKLRRSRMYRD